MKPIFDFKSLAVKFKTNTALAFYVGLIVVMVFEVFIFYTAFKQVRTSRGMPEGLVSSRGVRLQFTEYEQAAKRIEAGKDFQPNSPIFENPFGTK